jgi:hypothetical protein
MGRAKGLSSRGGVARFLLFRSKGGRANVARGNDPNWDRPIRVPVRSGPSALSRFWRNYNLSIVLAALFLFSWLLQTWTAFESRVLRP